MDRTERLLDLVALLLDAHEPVSWAELKESFPEDYGSGSDEATERKFERDKAELLELGIPLTYVQGDEDRKDGYLLDRNAYYLPEPDPALAAVGDEKEWIRESFEAARREVYAPPVDAGDGPFRLTAEYKQAAGRLAKARVALAGARLAGLLNAELR